MGRAGIRRRKPKRPLPKLHGDGVESDTPPVMWSPPGSGFEASPYSPAGRAQGLWRMARGASSRRRQPRWVVVTQWVVLVAVGGVFVVGLLSSLANLLW